MNPVDERFEHRLLDRFHYDDRQDGDGYGPDSPRVGDKGWIIWQTAFNELDRPFEIVRDEGRGRTGLPLLLVGMEDNYGDDWHIRENDDSQYMSLLEAGLDGASLTLMERKHGIARWRSERGESKPIELTAPDGKPTDTVYAYQSEPDEWRTNRRRARPTGSAAGPTTHRHNQNGSRNPNRPHRISPTMTDRVRYPKRTGWNSIRRPTITGCPTVRACNPSSM